MQYLLRAILLVGLLSALAASSPVQKRSFKVERVKNLNFKGHNGPRQLLRAYRKFSMPIPQGLIDAVNTQNAAASAAATSDKAETKSKKKKQSHKSKATGTSTVSNSTSSTIGNTTAAAPGTGLVVNTPEPMDVEYLSPVIIGGQTVNLDFDTGSSDLWVFNTQLNAQSTQGHTLFDPTKSKTFQMLAGSQFTISYGDGSGAAGNVGTDTVVIGGATVTKQAVELATAVSQSFVADTTNNGLVGLAFSKLNTVKPQQQKTFFDNVMPSLNQKLFAADLRKNASGTYEFGAIDNTKFTGQMTWVPVNTTQGFWQFSSTKFAVGTSAAQTGDPAGQAIADTGTTLILANMKVATAYYAQVQGAQNNAQAGGFTFPCNAQLPDLMLDVGGTMARVKGDDINFNAFVDQAGTTCFGGLQGTTSDLQIYGDVFFKSQYTVFNGGNNTLGFAQHA